MRLVIISWLLMASAVWAQQGIRATDRPYGQDELAGMLAGHAVEFFDGSVSRYRADGAYSYKYTESDAPWLGTWDVPEAGRVCVDFDNGSRRCDGFVDDGSRMVLVISDGTRFPVRERRALVDGY
ncbi:MAG: hypothetical protein QNJ44_15375 [Rhodobacter sp.]|nr:hypothetical protein [Rhodobacter sp.]